nr:PREDICTED: cyclin N-terminal domain-containing protein 1 [Latimeria chalumnae]|eukprot:XP_006006026.2 PREDICTED: cyclin N-terminal domain-containing protein 1 [Latimeria chalumnae]
MNKAVVKMRDGSSTSSKPFELVFGAASSEILEEFLVDLAKENEKCMLDLSEYAGCFKETRVVEFIFLLCDQFGLDQSAKYQAAEIQERFIIQHIEELYNSLSNTDKEQERKKKWGSLQVWLSENVMLRLVTCVQLASKLSIHYNIINNNAALKFLQFLGYSYSKEDILESELIVLKTLGFQVNIRSPFTHVETLLEVLGYNDSSVPVKFLYNICLKVLDLVYLQRDPIYECLLKTAIGNSTPNELQRSNFLSVKEDFMLLAVGIIATSAFVLNCTSWSQVIEHLSCITGITMESIMEFSHVILKHALGPAMHFKS